MSMSLDSNTTPINGRCAFRDCRSAPLNNAVPACEKHLCVKCRMAVAVTAGKDDTEIKYCTICSGSRKGLF